MTTAIPAAYFEAATALLATQGFRGTTIAKLCQAVGVTTGSFYHRFGSWSGFVDAFLEDWEAQQTARIIALASAPEDPRDQLVLLTRLAADVPHEAEAAIRAWASNNERVAAAQLRVDQERLQFTEKVMRTIVGDRRRARALAVHALSSFIGLQMLRPHLRPADIAAVMAEISGRVVRA
jgi:AcrR family transcriptional regulator